LLIDGDQFIYQASVAVEQEVRWDDENHVLFANKEEAYDTLSRMLKNETTAIMRAFGTEDYPDIRFCLTLGDSFRQGIYPGYKAGRPRKPMCYWEVRKRVETNFNTTSFEGLEADDIMGILATKPSSQVRIIVSQDKDMQTIPGLLWRKGELKTITFAEADRYFLQQTLTGDTTDGYPGCRGVGEIKAEKILNAVPEGDLCWPHVVKTFEKAGFDEDFALSQARCARILRAEDWDAENKKIKLWTPL
jgi:DNA polymerase-1